MASLAGRLEFFFSLELYTGKRGEIYLIQNPVCFAGQIAAGWVREVALSNHGVFFVVVLLLRLCFVFGTGRRDRNKNPPRIFYMLPWFYVQFDD